MHTRQDPYSGKWHIYTAPFTPLHRDGKMVAFKTQEEAEDFLEFERQHDQPLWAETN